jgi:hypothetical protein
MSLGDTVFFAGRSEEYGIKLPKLPKPKVMSPKDFGKMLYKVTGIEGGVKAGQALAKCKPSDARCIAKNLGNMAVAYSPLMSAKDRLSGIPGIGSKLGNVFDQVSGVGALKSSAGGLIRCKPNDSKCIANGIAETGLAASSFVPGAGAAGRAASVARTAATAAKLAKGAKTASSLAKGAKTVAKFAGKGAKMAGEAAMSAGGSAMDFAEDNAGALAGGAALLGAGALGAAALSRMGGGAEAAQGMAGGEYGGMAGGYGGMAGGYGGMAGGGYGGMAGGGYGGMAGGYGYPPPPAASAPVIVPAAPAAQAPPIKINIQISGKDMAASSGVFEDEIIGKPAPPGRATVAAEEEEAPSGGAKSALLGLAKGALAKKMSGGESFTLTGAPVERGVNWFAVIFFVMCILVLFFTSR